MTKIAPKTQPADTECKNLLIATGENMTAKKSTISLRTLSGLNCIPVGNCIHALATRIHNAERAAPIAVSHVAVKCIPRLTLFQPKNMIATKVASIKNAKIPSMANGAPKISPTNQL